MGRTLSYTELEVSSNDCSSIDRRHSRSEVFIRSLSELEAAVSAGSPKQSLERLSARLRSDRRTVSAYKFKIVPQATWKRRGERLSVGESERTERLARMLAHAEYVWDDRKQAREWMSKPHRELYTNSPLEAARTELGARRVEDLLDKLYYGLLCGRPFKSVRLPHRRRAALAQTRGMYPVTTSLTPKTHQTATRPPSIASTIG